MQLPHSQTPNILALACLIMGTGMFLISAAPVGMAFIIAGISAYICQCLLSTRGNHYSSHMGVDHHRLHRG